MEQENITEKLLQYIDGQLNAKDRAEIEYWISANDDVKTQYEQLRSIQSAFDSSHNMNVPSGKMTERFENWLDNQHKSKTVPLHRKWWAMAASVLVLVVAGTVAWNMYTTHKQKQELAIVKAELENTRNLIMTQMQNTLSASTRITAVHNTEEMEQVDDEIVHVLSQTLNEDPNSNVRMAALNALSKFYNQAAVKAILIESMKYQKDPVVQIALIQLLVQMKEKAIIDDLQKLIDTPGTMKAVKDEAYSGIFKLT